MIEGVPKTHRPQFFIWENRQQGQVRRCFIQVYKSLQDLAVSQMKRGMRHGIILFDKRFVNERQKRLVVNMLNIHQDRRRGSLVSELEMIFVPQGKRVSLKK